MKNPLKQKHKFSIAIPASLVSDIPHLREKSIKIGLVSRAASIFCVDEIVIFSDLCEVDQTQDINLIATILSYMETPQYLRRRIFKLRPELRYVGVLPPLRTPHHPLLNRIKDLEVGEYREGVVVSSLKEHSFVDIGVERPILIPKNKLATNTRVTVKITELGKLPKAVIVSQKETNKYWGYRVTVSKKAFDKFIKKRRFDLVIATSRRGTSITEIIDELSRRMKNARTILLAFGAPTQGLYEIVSQKKLELNEMADFIINTIPNQGTETVRTEEALYSSLAILNLLTIDTRI